MTQPGLRPQFEGEAHLTYDHDHDQWEVYKVNESFTSGGIAFVSSADGALMFQQVPMVEIDGMKLIQTKAILNYIAEKYNLHGKDLNDRVMYDSSLLIL